MPTNQDVKLSVWQINLPITEEKELRRGAIVGVPEEYVMIRIITT